MCSPSTPMLGFVCTRTCSAWSGSCSPEQTGWSSNNGTRDCLWTASSRPLGRLRALWQVLQMSSPWKMTPCCRRRCLRKAPAALMLRGPLGGSIRHYLEQPCGSGCERERAPKQRFRGLGFSSFRRVSQTWTILARYLESALHSQSFSQGHCRMGV